MQTNNVEELMCFISECFAAVLTLILDARLSAPTQFQRSQDFSIVSNIELNCNKSLSTNIKWIINICNTSSCFSQAQMDQIVTTTFSELFIPARSLSYGTYELKLTVTMIAIPNLMSSASTYVKIIPSSIQANLVQYGTSMIMKSHQQNLTLDPGKFSIDSDTTTFNASVRWNILYHIYDLFHSFIYS
jgi:hypothetical protein